MKRAALRRPAAAASCLTVAGASSPAVHLSTAGRAVARSAQLYTATASIGPLHTIATNTRRNNAHT